MGRKERERKQRILDEKKAAKEVIERRKVDRYSGWNKYWKKWQFWTVVIVFVLLIIYPFKDDIMGKKDLRDVGGAVIHTSMGDIEVSLFRDDAPKTVENFVKLTSDGFYNDLLFHRVIETFMIQTGDPNGDGTGGPGYEFEDEINNHILIPGSLAMANSGPNTNGSQFFIVTEEEQPHLDGKHTVFGEVISGQEIAVEISRVPADESDKPITNVTIQSIELINE